MIRYNYNRQVTPPAPFVHVSVHSPNLGAAASDLPALLDTAADVSVIPAVVAEKLALVPLGEVPIGGFDGRVTWVRTFLVQIAPRGFEPTTVRVVASRDEPHVLLGRDVLNAYRILLDGPRLQFEMQLQ